ncbi:2-hydroxyacid dehydrogenase [Chelatococcus asaccharovorans]|uniref:Glyoxylate/hydroxypyruvate reductase A n=1 Tax=Chelatococcus asaccharovorans TaxID=28210 RepID=A0A2V3UIW2_9HYPH|nr:glyoxylate/hydroxypyruvate reductase A [Chelatococcus asaccharovorans]MBS7706273.1 glyoxylate/hydroxypyruvate reductase A [Chelatococcus asaccharovorans]PXW65089.1 glyoxylate/hydroxypyruvate reductase A [Chelatococcus asaccharovorans]
MRRPVLAFLADQQRWEAWRAPVLAALAERGIKAELRFGAETPEEVDYILYAPTAARVDFSTFTRARAVLNLWAGVEGIVTDPSLTQPLCRMVDTSLVTGMVEYVTGHVLRHHLGMDRHVLGQDGIWRGREVPPLAADRSVGVLGLGELGAACAGALASLGFRVTGWSRRCRSLAGITCLDGTAGLDALVSQAEILVLLLPLTPATEGLIGAGVLARARPGVVLINPGRGGLIEDSALIAALDEGRVGHATLDAFREEPLPPEHPFWHHSKVTVTPHIAAATRPETAARVLAENIRRGEAGEPFLHLVDRAAGY